MIVLDQERLSDFFEMVSSGFGATRLEVIIVAAAIAAFVILLVVFALVQRGRARRQSKTLGKRRYRELSEKLQLTPSEEDLIRQLARYLKEPEKRHLLLVSQPTFNYCAQKLKAKRQDLPADLPRLRLKLGFTAQNPEAVPTTSTEIPVGTALLVMDRGKGGGRRVQGRLVGQDPQSLTVRLASDQPGFRRADPVNVLFQNRAGVFTFASVVDSREDALLRLAHAEAIRRIQRRKYYRRKKNLPVGVRKAGTEDGFSPAAFIELGGDGASLTNPGGRFDVGDTIELSFLAAGERYGLVAEVLRLSRNGERLHVRFAPMREATRDRIIGSLFRGA
jgi:hypothetical protein